MSREQQRYRAREYADRACARCHTTFTPRSGNTRNCDHCGDLRHRSQMPTKAVRPPRPRKPLIAPTAPDFLRALPTLLAELERVAPLGSKLTARDYRSVPLADLGCVRDRRGE